MFVILRNATAIYAWFAKAAPGDHILYVLRRSPVCLGADTFGRHFALADIFGYTRPENGMTSP
jgi:hypothetical protein